MTNADSEHDLNREILEHMMKPKNYGKLETPEGVGVGFDEKSGEYVILYIATEADTVTEIAFATNGCQDTVVLGSVFTEMVKGASLTEAAEITDAMEAKVADAPAKQQACSALVLAAFRAAVSHRIARLEGSAEEMHQIQIAQSCEAGEKVR